MREARISVEWEKERTVELTRHDFIFLSRSSVNRAGTARTVTLTISSMVIKPVALAFKAALWKGAR